MGPQFKGNIKETLERLLAQEDTDSDKKITVEDQGPKEFEVTLFQGENIFAKAYAIKGTYYLSNLLQELALEKALGKSEAIIPLSKIEEAPTTRISRMIRDYFWDDLTRTIDKDGIAQTVTDDKLATQVRRLYIPSTDSIGIAYYQNLQPDFPELQINILPENITPEYVRSINDKPGILSLALENNKGVPFVVPGGRFNEMYGWDSYFEGIGLLLDNRVDLAKAMVDNFCYQIEHYGKILNANRSYYLTRTQPPFLSSFIREVYEKQPEIGVSWLRNTLKWAIKEYQTVWMEEGMRLTKTGLNRYFAQGIGIPPETEDGHFEEALSAFAKLVIPSTNTAKIPSVETFVANYQNGLLDMPEVDTYFTHDRSLRESGHDTSWRLDDLCADLNVVDLNSMLYVYETDFGYLIKEYLNNDFKNTNAQYWESQALKRKNLVNSLLWNEEEAQFFDYNFKTNTQHPFESASNYFPLWAGLCSQDQAQKMLPRMIADLKELGGIAGSSKKMDDTFGAKGAQRQWDYPNGWAPHQMLLWKGLRNYGFEKELQELTYRWLWMITKNAVHYNGTIPEKYDVVAATHEVYAEYGNVGTEFDYITTSGFGWMNASYQYGLSLLNKEYRSKLDELVHPEKLFS